MLKSTGLIQFFRNEEPNNEGCKLEDILRYNLGEIESRHDFIQWIFPTKERSQYNPDAPLLDDSFKDDFQNDQLAKRNFCESCQLYLNHIGFCCKLGNIVCTPNPFLFYQLPPHNLLRITRVLNSLNQVGNIGCSRKLYKALTKEIELHPLKVNQTTVKFWKLTQGKDINETSTSK